MPIPVFDKREGKVERGILSLLVGRILISEKGSAHWSYEVARKVGAYDGSVWHVLNDFHRRGWIVHRYKMPNATNGGERVVFELTQTGIEAITRALRPLQISTSLST